MKKKRWLVTLVVIAGVIFLLAAAGGIYAMLFIRATGKITVGRLDLSAVADGTYDGQFKVITSADLSGLQSRTTGYPR